MLFKSETQELVIEGMSCPHCANHVKEALEKLGVKVKSVDHKSGLAEVKTKTKLDFETYKKALEEAGYTLKEVR